MFFKESSASKVGFVTLVKILKSWVVHLCGLPADHSAHAQFSALRRFPRETFSRPARGERSRPPTRRGKWAIPEGCSWNEL